MATVSTGVVGDASVGIDMGDGSFEADALAKDGKGIIVAPGDEDIDNDDDIEGDDGAGIDTAADEGDADGADDDGEGELSDLGEYSDDTLGDFDARYRGDNGELRLDILTREFDQNAAKSDGGVGSLNEGTYQYLEATYGLTKVQVQDIEAGQVAKRGLYYAQVNKAAGSQETLVAAVAWGKKAYSPEARKRFNEAYRSGDVERATEAVEALMARYNKANGKPSRRPVNAQRSATANTGGGKPNTQGFASRAEWQDARKEAKGDRRKEAEVNRKFRATNTRKWTD